MSNVSFYRSLIFYSAVQIIPSPKNEQKSSWAAKICQVNKRKLLWYDAQALDAGIR